MDRRRFLRSGAAVVLAGASGPAALAPDEAPAEPIWGHRKPHDPRALIMDAMGELCTSYEPPLVREMLESGIDSITVTLSDPKFVGAEALDVAVDGDNLHAYFDHIEHAIQVAGIEHVCIGSDRDHRVIALTEGYLAELRSEQGDIDGDELPWFIQELNGPRRMEVVWDGRVGRGYSEDEVERIMGRNSYRLYSEVMG